MKEGKTVPKSVDATPVICVLSEGLAGEVSHMLLS